MGDIAEELHRAIERSGMTRAEISREAGIPYAAIHGFCARERDIRLSTVERLCELFGLELKPVPSRRRK